MDKKRTIILAPYVHSTKNLTESFWTELVAELKRKNSNYVFYTNVAAPDEKIIPGTEPIVTTFPELMYIAEKVNCFIGLRSGLFDLLALTDARLLYINRNIFRWWKFDLDINFNHTNSKPFYFGPPEWETIRDELRMKRKRKRPDEQILFNHLKGKDIFPDWASLLKAIVDSVD